MLSSDPFGYLLKNTERWKDGLEFLIHHYLKFRNTIYNTTMARHGYCRSIMHKIIDKNAFM